MLNESLSDWIFYNNKFAWNLEIDAIEDGLVKQPGGEHLSKFIDYDDKRTKQKISLQISSEEVINRGKREGWINLKNRQLAREMFIVGKTIVLPPEIGFQWEGVLLDGGGWDKGNFGLYALAKTNPEDAKILKPFVINNLHSMSYPIENSQYEDLVRDWAVNLDYWQTLYENYEDIKDVSVGLSAFLFPKKGVKKRNHYIRFDSEKVKNDSSPIHALARIARETYFLKKMSWSWGLEPDKMMFNEIPDVHKFSLKNEDELKSKHIPPLTEVVAIYFNHSIYCPSPSSFKEALKIKENKLIDEWRQKMAFWTGEVASGNLNESQIRKEIDEANEYIKGSGYADRLIPKWTLLLTFPAGVAAQFLPGLQGLGWIGIATGMIQLHSAVAEAAVKNSNREKYRWLMMSHSI